MRTKTEIDSISGSFAPRLGHQARYSLRKFYEVLAIADLTALTGARGGPIVRIEKHEIDIRSVVQLHRAEFAECDHAKLGRGAATAIVDAAWQAVTIVEILTSETERVIENRIRQVRQLFRGFNQRLRATNVVQISAQQLATSETRQQYLRIESRISEGKTSECFFEFVGSSDARIGAFARKPREIFRVLLDGCGQQRTPGRERQQIGQQGRLFQDVLVNTRPLFRQPLPKETSDVLIGQIAKQIFRVRVTFRH